MVFPARSIRQNYLGFQLFPLRGCFISRQFTSFIPFCFPRRCATQEPPGQLPVTQPKVATPIRIKQAPKTMPIHSTGDTDLAITAINGSFQQQGNHPYLLSDTEYQLAFRCLYPGRLIFHFPEQTGLKDFLKRSGERHAKIY